MALLGLLALAFSAVIVASEGFSQWRHRHRLQDRAHALNNLRLIGFSLAEFEAEYGRSPDLSTIAAVKSTTSTTLTLDDSSSNKLFRQLLA